MLYPLVINWIKGSGFLELLACLMHFELDVTITKVIRSKILFFFFFPPFSVPFLGRAPISFVALSLSRCLGFLLPVLCVGQQERGQSPILGEESCRPRPPVPLCPPLLLSGPGRELAFPVRDWGQRGDSGDLGFFVGVRLRPQCPRCGRRAHGRLSGES